MTDTVATNIGGIPPEQQLCEFKPGSADRQDSTEHPLNNNEELMNGYYKLKYLPIYYFIMITIIGCHLL